MKPSVFMIALVLPLCACAEGTDTSAQVRAPAVEGLGEPVDCILTSRIRNTVVHDDYTIDFRMTGGDIYRNTLPNRCPSLGFEERFAYEGSTGNLCAVDTITVIESGGRRGLRCGLGPFVPVRYAEDDTGAGD